MTFPELDAFVKGRREEILHGYRQARLICWAQFQTSVGKKKKIKPENIFSLPNDGKKIRLRSGITAEEHKKLVEGYFRRKQRMIKGNT